MAFGQGGQGDKTRLSLREAPYSCPQVPLSQGHSAFRADYGRVLLSVFSALCPDLGETPFPWDTKVRKVVRAVFACRAPPEAHRKSHRPASLVPDGAHRPWDAFFHL